MSSVASCGCGGDGFVGLVLVVDVVVMGFVGFGFGCGVVVMGFVGFSFSFFRWWWWWLAVGCEFLFDIFLIGGGGWWQWVGGREEI